jgi:hypothetical protein
VLLKNALGFTLAAASVPSTVTRTWICLGVMAAGAVALAFWTFLRAQGVETWEARRGQRWTLATAIAGLMLLPIVTADANYDTPAPRRTNAPAVRGVFGRAAASLALVDTGRPVPRYCCMAVVNRDDSQIPTDTMTHRDLLVLLPVDVTQTIRDLHVAVSGEGGLDIALDPEAQPSVDRLETREYPNDSGPPGPDGRHIARGWVVRAPVRLNPTHIWDIGGMRYPFDVAASYRVGGDPQLHTFNTRAAIDAQVAPAIYEMAAASSLLPLLCLAAAVTRWRRTR